MSGDEGRQLKAQLIMYTDDGFNNARMDAGDDPSRFFNQQTPISALLTLMTSSFQLVSGLSTLAPEKITGFFHEWADLITKYAPPPEKPQE